MKILLVVGTRPELIKVAPIAIKLNELGLSDKYIILNTSQHKDLLKTYWRTFQLQPHFELDVMVHGQNLSNLTARLLIQFQAFLDGLEQKPCIILGQGDTTTVMASSIASFYNHIPFFHLEAGLRSFDFENPFPEEFNRRIASIGANHHFAPTENAKLNLLREGILEEKIEVTGNTVIDALQYIVKNKQFNEKYQNEILNEKIQESDRTVLITCHRRENHGSNLLKIIDAIEYIASTHKSIQFVWPVHPNPNVQSIVYNSVLSKFKNILLIEPIEYWDLLKLMKQSVVILTDSGGIQEEAPSFKVPVIVMRDTTERPEGLNMGHAVLVGANKEAIIESFERFLSVDREIFKQNPYGDGQASNRIVTRLLKFI